MEWCIDVGNVKSKQAPMIHHMGRVLGRPVVVMGIVLLYGDALDLVFIIVICLGG